MKASKIIYAVDAHTMGEPTRVILSGFPPVPGGTMQDKREWVKHHLDHLRTALLHEPRGHKDMFGALVLPPCNPKAHLGVLFMDSGGYLNMCVHGSIGVVTVALEMGLLEPAEPVTELRLDTPAGLITTKAYVKDSTVEKVTVQNVPSFLYRQDVKLFVPELRKEIALDVVFGGSFFALVAARELGIKPSLENLDDIVPLALAIRREANRVLKVSHPLLSHINTIDLVEIWDSADTPTRFKNVVVFGSGQVDHSPCGTGTCAKMAAMYARGEIRLNQSIVSESVIGTAFEGRLVGEIEVGGIKAVVPEITGQAWITGFSQFTISADDPLKYGFLLGPSAAER